MDAILIILGAITVLLIIVFSVTVVAALIVLAGPPDAHDVEIEGRPKTYTENKDGKK